MVRPEEGNVYTSVEPTFSSNPNVYFQRTEPLHVGMMYWAPDKPQFEQEHWLLQRNTHFLRHNTRTPSEWQHYDFVTNFLATAAYNTALCTFYVAESCGLGLIRRLNKRTIIV